MSFSSKYVVTLSSFLILITSCGVQFKTHNSLDNCSNNGHSGRHANCSLCNPNLESELSVDSGLIVKSLILSSQNKHKNQTFSKENLVPTLKNNQDYSQAKKELMLPKLKNVRKLKKSTSYIESVIPFSGIKESTVHASALSDEEPKTKWSVPAVFGFIFTMVAYLTMVLAAIIWIAGEIILLIALLFSILALPFIIIGMNDISKNEKKGRGLNIASIILIAIPLLILLSSLGAI